MFRTEPRACSGTLQPPGGEVPLLALVSLDEAAYRIAEDAVPCKTRRLPKCSLQNAKRHAANIT